MDAARDLIVLASDFCLLEIHVNSIVVLLLSPRWVEWHGSARIATVPITIVTPAPG